MENGASGTAGSTSSADLRIWRGFASVTTREYIVGIISLHPSGLAINRLFDDGIPHAALIVMVDCPRSGIFSDQPIE